MKLVYGDILTSNLFVIQNYCCRASARSTLFLTLHEVLAFSCPVPGRVIYGRNLDFCGGDVSNSGGKLSIQVCF